MIDINELRQSLGAVQPEEVAELLDRLEAAEKERDALLAKVAEMEKQEPSREWWDNLIADISAIDCVYRGCPSYAHDAYWLREHVVQMFEHRRDAIPSAQPAPSIPEVDALAQFIREIDGAHRLGAGVLAERIVAWLTVAPSVPEGWLRAIDEALVVAHIGVANASDTYEQAREKLDNLIGFHVDVATDPAVSGGWKLVPIEPTETIYKCFSAYDGTSYSNSFDYNDFVKDWREALATTPEAKP